jgi:hypothetical protein
MSRNLYLYATFAALAVPLFPVSAHELGAHVHGVATLQVAVDKNAITLDFSSPLHNLLGFEHEAHDARQKAAVKKMADTLNKADQVFIPTAKAQCSLKSVKLDSPALGKKGNSQPQEEAGGHADLDGEFVFACKYIDRLHDIDVNLFEAFPGLHQIKVEIATLKKQTSSRLTPDQRRIEW